MIRKFGKLLLAATLELGGRGRGALVRRASQAR